MLRDAAHARGVELTAFSVERPERIGPSIDEAKRLGAEALNVLASPILNERRLDIYERTMALRLPTIHQWPENPEEGGLIGYGPRLTELFRQLARQLAKVLRGSQAQRRPGRAADDVRAGHQHQDRQGDRLRGAGSAGLRADKVIE